MLALLVPSCMAGYAGQGFPGPVDPDAVFVSVPGHRYVATPESVLTQIRSQLEDGWPEEFTGFTTRSLIDDRRPMALITSVSFHPEQSLPTLGWLRRFLAEDAAAEPDEVGLAGIVGYRAEDEDGIDHVAYLDGASGVFIRGTDAASLERVATVLVEGRGQATPGLSEPGTIDPASLLGSVAGYTWTEPPPGVDELEVFLDSFGRELEDVLVGVTHRVVFVGSVLIAAVAVLNIDPAFAAVATFGRSRVVSHWDDPQEVTVAGEPAFYAYEDRAATFIWQRAHAFVLVAALSRPIAERLTAAIIEANA